VISFEDNEFWVEWTRERLAAAGLHNVDLRLRPVEHLPREIEALPDCRFDLVVVDFLEAAAVSRIDVLKQAMKTVRPGGLLLLDDSDRPGYAEACELLAGWRKRRFTGIKDDWAGACETAIILRPDRPDQC
jgi:predicted O-methyltransferase YrrM